MSNIVALPLNGHAPDAMTIAAHLREQAEWVESGQQGNVQRVIILYECDDGIRRQVIGEPQDRARVIGVLTIMAAKMANETD